MHLCNPLLKGETFVLSRLIFCRVLPRGGGDQPSLLYFSSHITKLCNLTAENTDVLRFLIYFVQFCATVCFSARDRKYNL